MSAKILVDVDTEDFGPGRGLGHRCFDSSDANLNIIEPNLSLTRDNFTILSGSSFYLNDDEIPIIMPSPYDVALERQREAKHNLHSKMAAISIAIMLAGLPIAYWQPNQFGGAVFVVGVTLWTLVGYLARRADR